MTFPKSERVIFSKNPLRSVICQIRYPPILTIEAEIPAKFQESVRQDFPQFEEIHESEKVSLPESIASIVPKEMLESLPARRNRRYQFMTKDQTWIISLTKDFVALEAKSYTRWEEFRTYMELVLTAILEVYKPTCFLRIGLRYQNIIDRDNLGLESTAWHELIARFILGPLAQDESVSDVVLHHGTFSLRLNDIGDFVRVRHGLGSDTEDKPGTEKYVLDNDFYTDVENPVEVENALGRLDTYNSLNRDLFNWCITCGLQAAMGPETP